MIVFSLALLSSYSTQVCYNYFVLHPKSLNVQIHFYRPNMLDTGHRRLGGWRKRSSVWSDKGVENRLKERCLIVVSLWSWQRTVLFQMEVYIIVRYIKELSLV